MPARPSRQPKPMTPEERSWASLGRERSRFPVLALHSSASSGGQWKALTRNLGWERPVLTPDLPGYGKASEAAPLMAAADLAREAKWLLQNSGLPAGPFHLVGHSYGGAVAMKLALLAPQRVRSLTLIEPVLFHLLSPVAAPAKWDCERRLHRDIAGLRDRIRGAVAAGWPGHGMAAFVDFWSGEGTWQRLDPAKRQLLAQQAKSVLRNFEAAFAESWPIDDVGRLSLPLQIIFGDASPAVTRRLCDLLVEAAGKGSHRVTTTRIFGGGHMAPITQAAAVNTAIVHHLEVAEGHWQRPASFASCHPMVA